MTRIFALIPALALLSACGKADGELTPGNWKNTVSMSKFEIPGAPPEVAKRAGAMLGQSQTMEVCMNAAQAKLGVREMSSSLQQGQCKIEDFTQGGGTMGGKMVCTSGPLGATTMAMNGTYTTEKIEMTMGGEVSEARLPGGKANIEMKITSERVGECKS